MVRSEGGGPASMHICPRDRVRSCRRLRVHLEKSTDTAGSHQQWPQGGCVFGKQQWREHRLFGNHRGEVAKGQTLTLPVHPRPRQVRLDLEKCTASDAHSRENKKRNTCLNVPNAAIKSRKMRTEDQSQGRYPGVDTLS